MSKKNITELDFEGIKNNLKIFLKSQSEFSDYNFEGSGMNVLLDILAYNTHYLAYNLNFSSGEMFLDSAVLRSSISSHAKTLGYLPRSAKSSQATINVKLNNPDAISSASILKGTKFTTSVANTTYTFVTNESVTKQKENGIIEFENVKLFEGTLVTTRYTVDENDLQQKFILPNSNVDIGTLKVTVQNSESDSTTRTFNLVEDITTENRDSLIYFLQESIDNNYEIYFGDGVVGKKLEEGNIVILEYIVTNKDLANGAFAFELSGNISGETDVTISTITVSKDGSEPETNSSIKKNSKLNYTSKNRAVTSKDYLAILSKIYPNVSSTQVWGGEDNDPPIYGKVFVSFKTKTNTILSNQTKIDIINDLRKYSIASVKPEIVDPETTKIICKTSFEYDENLTTKTELDLETDVETQAKTYNQTILNFGDIFRNSIYLKQLELANDSIISASNTLLISKTFKASLTNNTKYILKYNNQLYNPSFGYNKDNGGILSSTGFKVSGNTNTIFLDDDGEGNIRTYYLFSSGTEIIKKFINTQVGEINYLTGEVSFTLNITEVVPEVGSTDTENIRITVEPDKDNIVSQRNQLLEIDFEKSKFSGNKINL